MIDNEKKVICPYYIREGGSSVCCEGFCSDGHVKLVFGDEKKRSQWQKNYCMRGFRLCPIGYMVGKKYE